MVWLIKIFYGLSNAVLVTITVMTLIAQFLFSAIRASEVEMAEQRMEKLSQLSLAELGQEKIDANL